MGSTAQFVGRIAAGALTLGATEALGVGKKAGKLTSDVFLPGVAEAGNAVGNPDPFSLNKKDEQAPGAKTPVMTDAERERESRLARDKRKRDFQDLGRSGTILSGAGGLTGQGAGSSKSLLGL